MAPAALRAPAPPGPAPLRHLVPLPLQLGHLALQGVHLLPVDLAVHLSFLELEQRLLLLFPALDTGGQMEHEGRSAAQRPGPRMRSVGSLRDRGGGGSRGEEGWSHAVSRALSSRSIHRVQG